MDIDGRAFVFCALAVWRITHLLALEDGPFDLVFKLRRAVGDGFFGKLLDCFLCLSLWVAIPFALLVSNGWLGRVVSWLALSGSASVLFLLMDRKTEKIEKS